MHKIKKWTGRGTTSMALSEVLRKINPILRGWAAYFRYGVSKKTFSYLGWYAWWRMIGWIRRKHPNLTWKQIRRRYYGADRITEDDVTLYNPAKMRVERYRFPRPADLHALQHRRGRPGRSTLPPDRPRRCALRRPGQRTGQLTPIANTWRAGCGDDLHVRCAP
jgi:hypothetical protein